MPRTLKEWIGASPDTPIPPRVKLRIWTREKGRDYLTGRKILKGDKFEFEHKIAIINGGQNRESNIFLALRDKHKEKTKADLAEKSRVAAKAKADLGIKSESPRKIPQRAKAERQKREQVPVSGVPEIARRFGVLP